jgi:tetratricopeptide (TPR) repeat protein
MSEVCPNAAQLGVDQRYSVQEQLAQGEHACIYAVKDRLTGSSRALKIAHEGGGDTARRRFAKEYQLACELRHVNIARAYHYGLTHEGLPYYSLELVRGVSLEHCAGRGEPEFLANLAMQILDALATLHARGWVHGKIDARHLLVVGTSTTVLLRVIDLGQSESFQAVGEDLSCAKIQGDMQDLGRLLYGCLSHAEPNLRESEIKDVALHELNPKVPPSFSSFVSRLLTDERELRFACASDALEALLHLPDVHVGAVSHQARAERLLRGGALSHRPAELETLLMWAQDRKDKRGTSLCVVDGPTGMGKTPFIREAGVQLNLAGFRVIYLSSSDEPGAPLSALLSIPKVAFPEALPVEISFPNLDQSYEEDISQFAGNLARQLIRTLAQRPTIIMLENIQLAEVSSLEVLRVMRCEFDPTTIGLICVEDPRVDGLRAVDIFASDATHVAIPALNHRQISALCAHRLRGLSLPEPALKRLADDSRGMPSLIERTLAKLYVDGTIKSKAGSFEFVGGQYRAARHGDRGLLGEKIAQVSLASKVLLEAAAVLAPPIYAEDLAVVGGVTLEEAQDGLTELCRQQVLNVGEVSQHASFLFATRSLRRVVYEDLSTHTKQALHDRASTLASLQSHTSAAYRQRLEHVFRGSDEHKAINAAIEAGNRAADVYAYKKAIEYFARAYSRMVAPNAPKASYIAAQLGRLFERTGELERATTWYTAAQSTTQEPAESVFIQSLLGLSRLALIRGKVDEATTHTSKAHDYLEESSDSALRAQVMRQRALIAMQRGEPGEAESLLLAALSDFEAAQEPEEVQRSLLALARWANNRGNLVQAVRYGRRVLHGEKKRRDPATTAEALSLIGRALFNAARFESSRRSLNRGLRVARKSSDRLREASLLRDLGNVKTRQADFSGALDHYNRSLELARVMRSKLHEVRSLHNIGVVTSVLGRYRQALGAFREAFRIAQVAGDVQVQVYVRSELAHMWIRFGDFRAALNELGWVEDTLGRVENENFRAEVSGFSAWAQLQLGKHQRAERLLSNETTLLEEMEEPASQVVLLHYLALAAHHLGQKELLGKLANRLLQVTEDGHLLDTQASSLYVVGLSEMISGRPHNAQEKLTHSLQLACVQEQRPLEIQVRMALQSLLSDPHQRNENLRAAADQLRTISSGLPEHVAERLLKSRQFEKIPASLRRKGSSSKPSMPRFGAL